MSALLLPRAAFLKFAEMPPYRLVRWTRAGIIPRAGGFGRPMFPEVSAVAARAVAQLRARDFPLESCRIISRAAVEAFKAGQASGNMPVLVVTVTERRPWKGQYRKTAHAKAMPRDQVTKFLTAQASGAFVIDLPEIARHVGRYYSFRGVEA